MNILSTSARTTTPDRTAPTRRVDIALLLVALAGFLAGRIPDTIISFRPDAADILRQPWLLRLEIPASAVAVAALVLWARRGRTGRRWPLIATVFAVGALAAAFQALAVAAGWWQGPAYDAPWLALALAGHRGAFSLAAHLGLILLGYRWLSGRRPRLALALYGLVLLVVIPGTIAGDLDSFGAGAYFYRNGFTLAADVVYAEALFGVQLLLFEALRRTLPTTR